MRKQNPGESVVMKLSPTSEELASVQFSFSFSFNKTKHASVIPGKRRSVKRMIFDDFVQFIAHVVRPRNEANGSSFKKTKSKTVRVYPHNP